MPSAEVPVAAVERAGDGLCFTGALLRSDVAALWRQATPQLQGIRRLDLTAVSRVDSAGVALLAELAARCGGVAIDGSPAGLAELRAAYRLAPTLEFAAA
jgi:phospholipid transport system transporter-binding protein